MPTGVSLRTPGGGLTPGTITGMGSNNLTPLGSGAPSMVSPIYVEAPALAVHLDPLNAALLHLAGDMTHESVFGLVVVVVAVEEGAVELLHRGLQGIPH